MNHQDAEQMLARRPELTETEEARLEEHLQSCSQCRETAEAYARQASLMRALPVIAPPPALRAGVLAGIRQQPRRWSFRPIFALGPLGLVATAVLAALVYQNRPTSPGTLNRSAPPLTSGRPTAIPSSSRKQATFSGAQRPTHQSGKRHGAPRAVASPPGSKAGGTIAMGSRHYGSYQPSAPSNGADQSFGPPTPLPSSQSAALSAAPRRTSGAHTPASAPKGATPPITGGGGKPSRPTKPSGPPRAPVRPSATPKPESPAPPTIIAAAPQPTTSATPSPVPTPAPAVAAPSSATPTPTRTP